MKKRRLIIIVIIALLVLAGAFIGRRIYHKHHPQLATVAVQRGTIQQKVIAVGSIVPEKTAQVKSSISGTVEQLFHDSGDYVTTADRLLAIKPQPTPQDVAKAEQTVEQDVVKENTDLEDVQRYRYLLKQGAISPSDQDFATAQQQYKTDHLQRILDQEQLDLLEKGKAVIDGRAIGNLIYSPVNGYIVFRNVNLGDPVSAQTDYQQGTLLFVVADMQHMVFVGQVSQTDAAKLRPGMAASLDVAAMSGQKIIGTLNKLELASVQANQQFSNDQVNGTASSNASSDQSSPFNVGFQVKINQLKLPKGAQLRAGYSANAELVVKTVKDVPTLPERVLHFSDGSDKPYVWILDKDHQPQQQTVQLGLSDGMTVQILQGLKVGDRVLADYQQPSQTNSNS